MNVSVGVIERMGLGAVIHVKICAGTVGRRQAQGQRMSAQTSGRVTLVTVMHGSPRSLYLRRNRQLLVGQVVTSEVTWFRYSDEKEENPK